MNWITDEELKEKFNQGLKKQVQRETVTRWRNGSRSPKFEQVLEIEKAFKLPFEVYIRDANLNDIEIKILLQLKNLKKLISENEDREKLDKEIKGT